MASNASGDELIDVVVRLPRSTIEASIRVADRDAAIHQDARVMLAKALLPCRRRRSGLFAGVHFHDPAWDMMLELYVGAADGRQFRVSKLLNKANGSQATALRYFESLEDKGFVCRIDDPDDGRSNLALMQPRLKDAMNEWLRLLLSVSSLDHAR